MTTARDVVEQALKKAGILGIGRTASASDANDGLADLNNMISEWNTQRWMTWALLDVSKVSTGAASYTVGPAGDFAVSRRPDRIEAAYLRQLNTAGNLYVDTPVEIIPSREEYSRLTLKRLTSFTLYVFLDTAWPTGIAYFYPLANAAIYEYHLLFKNVAPVLTLDTDLSVVPDHYIGCMKFNLARRLRQAYGKGMQPDVELNNLARNSLDVVKQSNIQIPELVMPRTLIVQSSGYNILSDQFGNG